MLNRINNCQSKYISKKRGKFARNSSKIVNFKTKRNLRQHRVRVVLSSCQNDCHIFFSNTGKLGLCRGQCACKASKQCWLVLFFFLLFQQFMWKNVWSLFPVFVSLPSETGSCVNLIYKCTSNVLTNKY